MVALAYLIFLIQGFSCLREEYCYLVGKSLHLAELHVVEAYLTFLPFAMLTVNKAALTCEKRHMLPAVLLNAVIVRMIKSVFA